MVRTHKHGMCFMDDQVKRGPRGVKGRLGIARAGDAEQLQYFFVKGSLLYEFAIYLCFACSLKV